MKIRALAEAVILQSIEDLWHASHRNGSLEFLDGEGFDIYADLAGIDKWDRARLMKIFNTNIKIAKIAEAKKAKAEKKGTPVGV